MTCDRHVPKFKICLEILVVDNQNLLVDNESNIQRSLNIPCSNQEHPLVRLKLVTTIISCLFVNLLELWLIFEICILKFAILNLRAASIIAQELGLSILYGRKPNHRQESQCLCIAFRYTIILSLVRNIEQTPNPMKKI